MLVSCHGDHEIHLTGVCTLSKAGGGHTKVKLQSRAESQSQLIRLSSFQASPHNSLLHTVDH